MNTFFIRVKFLVAAALLFLAAQRPSLAGSATWSKNPESGDWNAPTNWMPHTVPNGSSDIASFGSSNVTYISSNIILVLDSVVFGTGAPPFTITSEMGTNIELMGAGIVNNSGLVQSFVKENAFGGIFFLNSASAGALTSFSGPGGDFFFEDSSSAGSASFDLTVGDDVSQLFFFDNSSAADSTINASEKSEVFFEDSSTAGNAVITAVTDGDISFGTGSSAGNMTFTGSSGGNVGFSQTATAGNGHFTANGAQSSSDTAGYILFGDTSTAAEGTFILNGGAGTGSDGATMSIVGSANAASATITVNAGANGGQGGALIFQGSANAGTASLSVFGNGKLDISARKAGVIIGSITGDGCILLGPQTLTIGSNNVSTTFSGVIQGTGGVIKSGTGTLALNGRNTYTGATTVSAGSLGGSGSIAGTATVAASATIAPAAGTTNSATMKIENALTFQASSTYSCLLSGKESRAKSDRINAKGVTISSGAQFILADQITGRLRPGTSFTVISNTSTNPISGTFANLADGAVLTVNRTNFKASYEGGDGNDLTLTVQ